jgi:photosystem II stability/assembly factor-like uncharacterized protein
MAKAGIVYVGTADGVATYTDPGGQNRWRRAGRSLEGDAVLGMLAADHLTLVAATASGTALRSDDGGQSWRAASGDDAARLQAFVAAEGLVVNTAHGPAHWRNEQATPPGAVAMGLLAGKSEVLIAAIADGTTLVRSEDGGATWQQADVVGGLAGGVRTIVPASYHMDYAWAGTDAGQLLRSDDRGRTWREVAVEPAAINAIAVVRIESAA